MPPGWRHLSTPTPPCWYLLPVGAVMHTHASPAVGLQRPAPVPVRICSKWRCSQQAYIARMVQAWLCGEGSVPGVRTLPNVTHTCRHVRAPLCSHFLMNKQKDYLCLQFYSVRLMYKHIKREDRMDCVAGIAFFLPHQRLSAAISVIFLLLLLLVPCAAPCNHFATSPRFHFIYWARTWKVSDIAQSWKCLRFKKFIQGN